MHTRKIRILTRFLKQRLGIEKCNYNSDLKMLRMMFKWTKDFENDRTKHEERLKLYSDKLIWIKSVKELNKIDLGELV